MLLCTILFPILAGTAASLLGTDRRQRRNRCIAVLLLTDLLGAASLAWGTPAALFPLTENLRFSFALDPVGKWFLAVVLLLYTAICFYAFVYMEVEEREGLFFAFYFVSMGAMIAVCMAANLVSLYLCFELVTLTSMPLVLHERTPEAVAAGLKYLFYSIGGAFLGLLSVIFLKTDISRLLKWQVIYTAAAGGAFLLYFLTLCFCSCSIRAMVHSCSCFFASSCSRRCSSIANS